MSVSMTEKRILKLMAPYFAVFVFWVLLSNAWLALFAYHAQILFWLKDSRPEVKLRLNRKALLLALPTVVAGPVLYFLLPHMTHSDLPGWLGAHHVSRLTLALMIPYFGLVHPCLEQLHWSRLRDASPLSHLVFAGYHVIVLYSLLGTPWLVMSFVVLAAASFLWHWMERTADGLTASIVSHVLADLGVIVAAWLRV